MLRLGTISLLSTLEFEQQSTTKQKNSRAVSVLGLVFFDTEMWVWGGQREGDLALAHVFRHHVLRPHVPLRAIVALDSENAIDFYANSPSVRAAVNAIRAARPRGSTCDEPRFRSPPFTALDTHAISGESRFFDSSFDIWFCGAGSYRLCCCSFAWGYDWFREPFLWLL